MKTIVLFLFAALPAFGIAQPGLNHWSIDAGIGACHPVSPYTTGAATRALYFPAFSLGGRYSINSRFGVRAVTGFGSLRSRDASSGFATNCLQFNLEGVVNLGQVLDFQSIHPNLGLLLHAGAGISSLSSDSLRRGRNNGSDEMASFILGLTPRYRVSERVVLQADFAVTWDLFQTRTFDMKSVVSDPGIDGCLLSATIGVSVSLGKNASHTDWYDETAGRLKAVNDQRRRYDSIASGMQDGDSDGVPDYLDLEPRSAQGAQVNVKGITVAELPVLLPEERVETIDGFIEFPSKPGLFFTVQIGAYENAAKGEQLHGLQTYAVRTITGQTRYLYSICTSSTEARRMKDIAFERGVAGAFVTAYYQGKRITVAEAERLLWVHGPIILEAE